MESLKEPAKLRVVKNCNACGGRGVVHRAYVEKNVPANHALEKVPCPKCLETVKIKPGEK